VATVVLSDKNSDETLYVEPEKTTKEVTYQFADLDDAKDGKIIPIEDAEHLKEAIINVTATSNAGSTWYCGGGALCFNSLQTDDGNVWAAKSFMYNGTGDVTVKFDGTFSIADPDGGDMLTVEGKITEKSMILQDWWKSSEKDDNGADVECTYNSITLVYDYAGAEVPTEEATTEEATTEEATTEEATTDSTEDTSESTVAPTGVSALAYGDVNEDGKVDIIDVIKLNKYLLGADTLSDQGKYNADVDINGKTDSTDSLNILKFVVEILHAEDFPVK
ncbi:MAG: dockerin type I repeat-containing protein, partial [Oscillospiraceae bacterium]|nr:dockerin type I repeat-containing protein [Oscillospiraceae bacterium]